MGPGLQIALKLLLLLVLVIVNAFFAMSEIAIISLNDTKIRHLADEGDKKAKQIVKPDITIIVMSPQFVQRGEPAIISKWARSRIAIESGADLVIELPTIYAVESAVLENVVIGC